MISTALVPKRSKDEKNQIGEIDKETMPLEGKNGLLVPI